MAEAKQLKLATIEAAFAASGIAELPEGVTSLTRREMMFVLGVLQHGQMAKAAVEAGYSQDSAQAIASETLRRPKVFAFYRRCVEQVAGKGEELVRRVYERSVIYHAKAITAGQAVADANEWLMTEYRTEKGRNAKDRVAYELARDRAMREEKHYTKLANETDALLGALLGKLKIKVEGSLKVNVVSDDDRQHLVDLQRQGVRLDVPAHMEAHAMAAGAGGRN